MTRKYKQGQLRMPFVETFGFVDSDPNVLIDIGVRFVLYPEAPCLAASGEPGGDQ